MSTTFDSIVSTVREQPTETQEVVGRFMQAVLSGESVSLTDIEEQFRVEHTRRGLAEAERGEGTPVDEAFARIRASLQGQQQT